MSVSGGRAVKPKLPRIGGEGSPVLLIETDKLPANVLCLGFKNKDGTMIAHKPKEEQL